MSLLNFFRHMWRELRSVLGTTAFLLCLGIAMLTGFITIDDFMVYMGCLAIGIASALLRLMWDDYKDTETDTDTDKEN